ncbi:protein O-mannosyl-transferase TMTC4 isoform X1 [Tribolium castaneum]|uniref:protein O-mannosyl-transferase TMTC4 isoform X1 n=1 Tax=Tribolium castaneum TaxID=7070 RepID=UPI00077DBAC3|nr:PREDICTED: transmembrane and TPR repeat-containing protein 4 isoform X1 [Tribolium castaneum]|eukprot:XP_015835523.1 PREDICTED: transmembrane and TPR repeat-containing protein 4 isoform X1 [Tribolium castaneum]
MEKSKKYITISVAAFICYCNTLWGSFVFDDTEAIVKNKDVMPYIPLNEIFRNDFWGSNISLNSSHKSYRPLTILSYRLNVLYSNNKLDAFQFHATNVILYGLLCLLTIPVFELFLRKKKTQKSVDDTAYLSSLLFTVHPIHTECVAGLVGRADILCSILFFIVILLYDKAISKKSFVLLCIVVVTTAAAVLCKETAITVLGVCVVYDLFLLKKQRKDWCDIFNIYFFIRTATLVVTGLVILFYRFKIMNFEGPTFTSIDNPAAYADKVFIRIFSYNYIYFLNFLLLLWPQWLCFDWSMGCIPLIERISDKRILIVLIFWIITLISVHHLAKKVVENRFLDAKTMALGLIIFPFLPASNLFLKVGFVIAERTLLLPSAGFCLLVVIGLKKIQSFAPSHKTTVVVLFYTVCVIFTLRSIQRNFEWLREETLFTSALNVCPLNAKVHYNIAKIAGDQNNKTLALSEYKKALELNPNYEQAMNNLANLLREDRKFGEAEALLRKALDVSCRPNFAAAWMNLGIVLTNLNRTEEAEHCYKTAIKFRNKYPDCYYNLGNLYLDQKRNDEALDAWEMAVLYRPSHVAAWSNTLVLLDSMRQYDKVLELGITALIHNPKSPALHFSLANTLGKIQRFEKAESHFLEAINLNPNNALYHSNLGVLYHRWGKVDKAREMYKKALQIDPHMKTTELNLRKLVNAQD